MDTVYVFFWLGFHFPYIEYDVFAFVWPIILRWWLHMFSYYCADGLNGFSRDQSWCFHLIIWAVSLRTSVLYVLIESHSYYRFWSSFPYLWIYLAILRPLIVLILTPPSLLVFLCHYLFLLSQIFKFSYLLDCFILYNSPPLYLFPGGYYLVLLL